MDRGEEVRRALRTEKRVNLETAARDGSCLMCERPLGDEEVEEVLDPRKGNQFLGYAHIDCTASEEQVAA